MGCEWYDIVTYYGLVIDVPGGEDYRKFVSRAYKLQAFLDEGFEIVSLLTKFHSNMYDDCKELDGLAVLCVGFKPSNNLEDLARRGAELEMYVKDNIVFEGYDVISGGKFFSGIKWDEDVWGLIEDDEEDEEDEEDEDEDDEEDCDDEEDSEDDLSCEDECCVTAAGGAGATK